jgi:hypothetical protein
MMVMFLNLLVIMRAVGLLVGLLSQPVMGCPVSSWPERKWPQFTTYLNFQPSTIRHRAAVESLTSAEHSMQSDTNWKCIVARSQINRLRTKSNAWPDASRSSVQHSLLSRGHKKRYRLAGQPAKRALIGQLINKKSPIQNCLTYAQSGAKCAI